MVELVNLVVQEVLARGVCSETWIANSNIKQIQKSMGVRDYQISGVRTKITNSPNEGGKIRKWGVRRKQIQMKYKKEVHAVWQGCEKKKKRQATFFYSLKQNPN